MSRPPKAHEERSASAFLPPALHSRGFHPPGSSEIDHGLFRKKAGCPFFHKKAKRRDESDLRVRMKRWMAE